MSQTRIRYYTRFLPSLERGGGSRRMLQICEALDSAALEVISEPRGDLQDGPEPAVGHPFLDSWATGRRKAVQRLYAAAEKWVGVMQASGACDLAVVDDPIYFPPLMDALEESGTPILAVCHNIESLVPSQYAAGAGMRLLERELSLLRRCRGVVTISREETAILTNLGIRAWFTPYFPPAPIARRMLRIRGKRRWKRKSGYLLLGTAFNPETVSGMKKIMDLWLSRGMAGSAGMLHVAGFRTEKHFPRGERNGVIVHGTMDDDALDELLVGTRACIAHQDAGAGALTRLVEMNLAGIPVLANPHAARTHYGLAGLHEYRDLEELRRMLRKRRHFSVPAHPPAKPSLPAHLERYLEKGSWS